MHKGIVFSILRGSLHDGPGIRTTVFLKGCNLRCIWCHNPEGNDAAPQLAYRAHQCIGCGSCVQVCPVGAHHLANGEHMVDFAACRKCGQCIAACPAGALQLYGREMTVAEVLSVVLKDKNYYKNEGGLTLSGGEPLLQPDFAEELLREAKRQGVHTCIETAGCVEPDVFDRVMPFTDLFLFDYKASPKEQHQRLTGADNSLILSNLQKLYAQGAKIRLRCPLVPGCNDTDEHLAQIAGLAGRLSALEGVEVMPYHDFGAAKAVSLGREPRFAAPSATAREKQQWMDRLHAMGAANVQIND